MIETLPPTICTELEIIRRLDPVGILKCLPTLFDVLAREKNTKEYLYDLEKQLERENKREEERKIQAITWMESKFKEIKKNPLSKHPTISLKIAHLEDTMQCRRVRLDQNYISSVWDDLREVSESMVEFGPNEIFDDWARIDIRTESQTITGEIFSKESKICEILPGDKQGLLLIDILKQGFTKASLVPAKYRPGSEKPTVNFEYGYIKQFIVPDCISPWYQHSQDGTEYDEGISTDPLILFKRLQFLSQYSDFKPLVLPLEKPPKNWKDIDLLHAQASSGFYFHRFKSIQKKPPLTSEQAIKLIETFLLIVSRFRKIREKKRANKNDAKKFIEQRVLKLIQNTQKNGCKFPKNKEVYDQIMAAAQKINDSCISEISQKLVASTCCILLKRNNIVRKGGRPKKN